MYVNNSKKNARTRQRENVRSNMAAFSFPEPPGDENDIDMAADVRIFIVLIKTSSLFPMAKKFGMNNMGDTGTEFSTKNSFKKVI